MTTTTTTQAWEEAVSDNPSLHQALLCARAALDKKAENIKVLDLSQVSSFCDYFVICSGMSDRQVQAITNSIESELLRHGLDLLSSEGYNEGRWVLMDFGSVVVHVFLDALREYYDLESLWATATKVKLPSEFFSPAASPMN